MNDKIPGVPEGWELARIGKPEAGEWFINGLDDLVQAIDDKHFFGCVILRKIEKPATYRPFANAEEFKPHRDRWLTRKDKSDPTHLDGACRVAAYDDQGSWFTTGNYHTWEAAFDSGRCFDDDGTPFGVRIDE
jgi:hypothetical protein